MTSTMKALVLSGLAIVIAFAMQNTPAALGQAKNDAATATRKVVWDGDRTFPKAFGHVEPKEKNSIAPQTDEVHRGKVALEFIVGAATASGGKATASGGWNWHGWYPGDSGDDLTAYSHLVFWVKVEKGKKIDGMKVGLESSTPREASPMVEVTKYCPAALDGQWHEVAIPAADFTAGGGKFNPKLAWELRISLQSDPATVPYSVFFDDIAYEQRAGAATQPAARQ
jgi:hypothetical protein